MMAAQALANAKQPISGNATVSGSPVGASFLPPSSGSGVGVGGSGVGVGPGGLGGSGGLGVGPGSAGATVNDAEAVPSVNIATRAC